MLRSMLRRVKVEAGDQFLTGYRQRNVVDVGVG